MDLNIKNALERKRKERNKWGREREREGEREVHFCSYSGFGEEHKCSSYVLPEKLMNFFFFNFIIF